jgi:hypothetical protein
MQFHSPAHHEQLTQLVEKHLSGVFLAVSDAIDADGIVEESSHAKSEEGQLRSRPSRSAGDREGLQRLWFSVKGGHSSA